MALLGWLPPGNGPVTQAAYLATIATRVYYAAPTNEVSMRRVFIRDHYTVAGLGIANIYPLTLATGIAGLVAPFVIGSLADRSTIQRACGAAGYALHCGTSAWLGSGKPGSL